MRLLLLFVVCLLLASCETSNTDNEKHTSKPSSTTARSADAESKYTPAPLTNRELAVADAKEDAYNRGLARTIDSIDDGTSPAKEIAKQAVEKNLDKLISWKRALLVNYSRLPAMSKVMEREISRIPTKGHIDYATEMVLAFREYENE